MQSGHFRKQRAKKAAVTAAFIYLSVVGLGLGMLRAAQQTRRTLYGGTPVLAQLSQPLSDHAARARTYQLTLGGGEWSIRFSLPVLPDAAAFTDALPPTAGKLFLRLALLSDSAADYTAVCISGM